MFVTKRNGKLEEVNLNKIVTRIKKLKEESPALSHVEELVIAQKVINGLYDKVTTRELDELAAETSAAMSTIHPDYDSLAARIEVSNLHKETSDKFSQKIKQLYKETGIISKQFYEYVLENASSLDSMVDYSRDYLFDYFGVKTLKRSYLLKTKTGDIVERPQDLWMRVASFIHAGNLEATKETYDLLSNKYFTHATPTLFNAGTVRPQLSSCFLLDIDSDSIAGIYKTLSDCATISQSAGGIGLAIHKIRSSGSYINGTNGHSNGIIPMLRVFDATARYVDQGGGKRKGSIAIYVEPWHSDIFEFLDLKKNHGKEELRARDLFYALWIPDLFMKRVQEDGVWTLFDPAKAYVEETDFKDYTKVIKKTYLYELYGDNFETVYRLLEKQGLGKQVKARELWEKILANQIETGVPYILYKDACNEKSNQKNLGTIKSSNLCTEIIEYTDENETAVCNLASISLPAFLERETNSVQYEKLYEVSKVITRNLNKVIDVNYYPTKETRVSNFRHRPIGIGVQGLADLYAVLKLDFDSAEAKEINKRVFETIYHGAVDSSIELARRDGAYESYQGSPASHGRLQFDLWGVDRSTLSRDWSGTFENLRAYGLRNSLLLAPMPTASTAQILGNNEAFEPFTSNLYTRRTLAGEFIVVNKHLISELLELGLWNEQMRQRLIAANGSVQGIVEIPEAVRMRYRTAYEMSARAIIDQAADRGAFICQSQSMNIFMPEPTVAKLTSMHFYGWSLGLKTGSYYIRSEPARDAIKFTINKQFTDETKVIQEKAITELEPAVCSIDDPNCESCGA
jgi:ribonucleoside-diphosphate reductase alpha chain